MIAIDTNVLVYAHREGLSKHQVARRALTELAEGRTPWALQVFCLGEFLRVVTNARVFDHPFTADEASEALGRVLQSPSVRVLIPGDAYPALLLRTVREMDVTGNLVFDAQIVALCREAGVSALLTEDRDFARFRGFVTRRLK